MPHEIRPGIRRLFRLATRRGMQQDADEEIQLHLQLRARQLIDEGMSPSEARAEARRRFGDVDDERRRSRASAGRRERRMRWRDALDRSSGDVRYALRTLRLDAGFTAFALVILALGIAASATVFSLVNGVLLRPMPFKDPSRLVWISNIGDNGSDEWRVQVGHFVNLAARAKSLSGIGGYFAYYNVGDAALNTHDGTERLTQVPVTCGFFPVLGVRLHLGRSFADDECRGDTSSTTAILSDKTWHEQFGADPSVVGRVVTVNGQSVRIIGVLPASFNFASVFTPGTPADLFIPYALNARNDRDGNTLAVVGRLKPGVTLERSAAELPALGKQLTAEFPQRNTLRLRVESLDERVNGRFRPALLVLALAVAAVMLIVAVNLASLQFARLSARSRELALRVALGASRGRIVRQTLTESLVLACGGAAAGVALAVVATRYLSRLHAFDIPLLSRVGVDAPVLTVAGLVAVIAGAIVGLLPALQSPVDPNDALKDGTRGATRGGRHTRVRSGLVVTEIAGALVLLVASSLLIRSFVHALDSELGFVPDHLVRLRVDPPTAPDHLAQATPYYDEVLRRIRATPGVTAASLSDMLPFTGDRSWGVPAEGRVYQRGHMPEGFIRFIGTDYFRTMGIRLVAGRDFTDGDDPGSPPVVIINESMARKLWPGRSALGQRVVQGKIPSTVIGIVADVRHTSLETPFTGEVYFPMRQIYGFSRVDLVVRTPLPLSRFVGEARAALAPVAPDAARNAWSPMQSLIDEAASPRRFVVLLLSGFAAFAVMISALGVYALISFGVTQRRQELGIRIALGASSSDVGGAIMRETMRLTVVGGLIGTGAALLMVPAMNAMLFGVTWRDPISFACALVALLIVAGAAGFLPARRATRVDPSVALRSG